MDEYGTLLFERRAISRVDAGRGPPSRSPRGKVNVVAEDTEFLPYGNADGQRRREMEMEPLLIGLAIVDELDGGRGMRQLADGWMNREPRRARRARALAARALRALAVRLAPAQLPAAGDDLDLPPAPAH